MKEFKRLKEDPSQLQMFGDEAVKAINYNATHINTIEQTLTTKANLVGGKVPSSELPSYVDDVVEYASLEQFPAEGEAGKIYVADDTGATYRWSGSDYIKVGAGDIMLPITYSDLKTIRDAGELTPGMQYRITDYACTTIQTHTYSAGHQFDIIVVADSVNKLNEQARAILHEGDTYFANCKLEAWQIWYSIDNDTDRFTWADATNGKGVIYRMIDEFGNDCPYDFKNILFTDSSKFIRAYTFSYTESSTIKDASILGNSKKCYLNVIKPCASTISSTYKLQLNFNVFYSTSTSFECYCNTFDKGCYSNTVDRSCYHNSFADDCAGNVLAMNCYNNIFGNSFRYNVFKNNCSSNVFGNNCSSNYLGKNCSYNNFGNHCRYITFGTSTTSSAIIDYCQYNTFDVGCSYLYVISDDTSASSSNLLQNIHVHSGVSGTSQSNMLTITVPDRNLAYETDVYKDENGTLIYKKNNYEVPSSISYLTTAPVADNTDGDLKFVVLTAEPATRYNGYLYIITESQNQ